MPMQLLPATLRYFEGIPSTDLKLAIVGKDPFPSCAIGIPFCKPTWEQQFAINCSGRYVLLSLGIDPATAQTAYAAPAHLFDYLRTLGIVFLNASYIHLDSKLRKRHLCYMQHAYQINRLFLNNAQTVLYCGEASKIRWITPITRDGSYSVVHPDVRNKVHPHRSVCWLSWWGDGVLRDKLSLNIPSRF